MEEDQLFFFELSEILSLESSISLKQSNFVSQRILRLISQYCKVGFENKPGTLFPSHLDFLQRKNDFVAQRFLVNTITAAITTGRQSDF